MPVVELHLTTNRYKYVKANTNTDASMSQKNLTCLNSVTEPKGTIGQEMRDRLAKVIRIGGP